MNCRDCARALYPYLDRELSEQDIAEVKEHLLECGGCLDLYQFEDSVRRLVRVRCQEQSAPESLRERITLSFSVERTRLERRKSQ